MVAAEPDRGETAERQRLKPLLGRTLSLKGEELNKPLQIHKAEKRGGAPCGGGG
jgi:hypothetical protein